MPRRADWRDPWLLGDVRSPPQGVHLGRKIMVAIPLSNRSQTGIGHGPERPMHPLNLGPIETCSGATLVGKCATSHAEAAV